MLNFRRLSLALGAVGLGLSALLALTLLFALGTPVAAAAAPVVAAPRVGETCFATLNGSFVYSSPNASAVQLAVNAASAGALVKVAGTCAGVQNINGFTQTLYISTSNLTIRGGYTTTDWNVTNPVSNPTTLSALGQGRVVFVPYNVTVLNTTLDGFHLTLGDALNNPVGVCGDSALNGGGGLCLGSANGFALLNSQVYSNVAGTGGGIYRHGGGNDLAITNTVIFSNVAATGNGGGIYQRFDGLALYDSTVRANYSQGTGGGIQLDRHQLLLSHSSLRDNTSNGNGGGLGVGNLSGVVVALMESEIVGNRAGAGGGVQIGGGDMWLTATKILSNTALGGSGGGFLLAGGGTVTVVNSLLADNVATNNLGAALALAAGQMQILHTTIARPLYSNASAIYLTNGTLTLTNTLIANHGVGLQRTGGVASEDYNLFDNVTLPYSGTVLSGGNSLTGTAGFVNAGASNYRLTQASAAVNTGTNLGVTTDLEGVARPQGSGYDIGAYEYAGFTPVANADAYTGTEDVTLTVGAAAGLLANDTAANGGGLTATLFSPPASGALTLTPDGAFTYTPAANVNGPITFQYLAANDTPALQAYWPFDDGTNPTVDPRGVYSAALLNGVTFTTNLPPTLTTGLALQFDGVDDSVVVTDPISLANQSFSVAFWAQRASLSGNNDYVVGQGTGSNNQTLHIGFRNNNTFKWYLLIKLGQGV